MKIHNYIIENIIGKGSFGEVYAGRNIITNKLVAIKRCKKDKNSFINEIKICNYLNNIDGIYKLHWYGIISEYRYLVLDRLGPSLSTFIKKYKKFDLSTINYIAINMINILEKIHNLFIIHRDIKLDNILVDYYNNKKIYLIDFGLAKIYTDKNNKHLPEKKTNSIIGTPTYISIFIHNGFYPSRRDDIISVGYVLEELLEGYLKWSKEININNIFKLKNSFKSKNTNINRYITHAQSLSFIDTPNYYKLNNLFNNNNNDNKTLLWKKFDKNLLQEY